MDFLKDIWNSLFTILLCYYEKLMAKPVVEPKKVRCFYADFLHEAEKDGRRLACLRGLRTLRFRLPHLVDVKPAWPHD